MLIVLVKGTFSLYIASTFTYFPRALNIIQIGGKQSLVPLKFVLQSASEMLYLKLIPKISFYPVARTVKIPLKWLNGGRQLGQYNGSTAFLISGVKLTRLLLCCILQMKLHIAEEVLQMAQICPY